MVSVIIPAYNREKTIRMAVESVLGQTYRDLEVIVVDDCSTDGTVEAIRQIGDGRIRIVECEKNGGACRARNIGIGQAKGEFIAFQDSDDYWYPDKLEKDLYHLEKEQADFVFSAFYRKWEDRFGGRKLRIPSYNLNLETDKMSRLLQSNCVSTQTIAARREVFEKVRFDERFPRYQDWDLALQVVRAGFSVYYIEEPLVDCFVQDNSISSDEGKVRKAVRLLETKYRKEFEADRNAYSRFYFYLACSLERRGGGGAYFFRRSFQIRKNIPMLIRYLLARMGLYRFIIK